MCDSATCSAEDVKRDGYTCVDVGMDMGKSIRRSSPNGAERVIIN